MADLLIQPNEILDLVQEVGHTLYFLVRTIATPGDMGVGIPPTYSWQKRPLAGYVVPYSPKAIYLSPSGAMPVIQGDYIAYIAASSFSPDLLSGETFIEWNHRNFNVETTEAVYHRQQILLYKLMLKQTQDQQVIQQDLPTVEAGAEEPAIIDTVALAGWTDLRLTQPDLTIRDGLTMEQTVDGLVPSDIYDWSAWIYFNQTRDLGAQDIQIIADISGVVLLGLAPEPVSFSTMPQQQMLAGVHLSATSVVSLLRTDGNFYNLAATTALGQALHLIRFFKEGSDLMVSISELSETWQASPVLQTSLGSIDAQMVHLALIAPHQAITLLATN